MTRSATRSLLAQDRRLAANTTSGAGGGLSTVTERKPCQLPDSETQHLVVAPVPKSVAHAEIRRWREPHDPGRRSSAHPDLPSHT